jgi:hypothetical protein
MGARADFEASVEAAQAAIQRCATANSEWPQKDQAWAEFLHSSHSAAISVAIPPLLDWLCPILKEEKIRLSIGINVMLTERGFEREGQPIEPGPALSGRSVSRVIRMIAVELKRCIEKNQVRDAKHASEMVGTLSSAAMRLGEYSHG